MYFPSVNTHLINKCLPSCSTCYWEHHALGVETFCGRTLACMLLIHCGSGLHIRRIMSQIWCIYVYTDTSVSVWPNPAAAAVCLLNTALATQAHSNCLPTFLSWDSEKVAYSSEKGVKTVENEKITFVWPSCKLHIVRPGLILLKFSHGNIHSVRGPLSQPP